MRITAVRLVAGFLVVCFCVTLGQARQDKQPVPEKDPKAGAEKIDRGAVVREIQQAYEGITDLAQAAPTEKAAVQLFEHAKTFYRDAVKAYPSDPRRARELAGAANDTMRGLLSARRSAFAPVAGLPEPPTNPDAAPLVKDGGTGKEGPWTQVLDSLNRLRDPIANSGTLAAGVNKDFFDEAARAYREGRKAYDAGDYRKAGELAKAATAWFSVMDRLDRAGGAKAETAPFLTAEPKSSPPVPPVKQ